jgi:2-amino-4-hydroxy-6-hydroxymethyldihydropteridine diphosphokinase
VIDIDIVAYDNLVIAEPDFTLPHPLALERAFVLVPLEEIAPDLTIGGVSVREASARLDRTGVERLPPR